MKLLPYRCVPTSSYVHGFLYSILFCIFNLLCSTDHHENALVLHIFFRNKVPLIQGLFMRFWTDTLHSTVHQSCPFWHTALFKYPRTQLLLNLAVVKFKTYLIRLPAQKVVTSSRYLAIMINSQYLSKYAIIKYFNITLYYILDHTTIRPAVVLEVR